MKKVTRILFIFFGFIITFVLASCGKKSGVDVAIEESVFANRIVLTLSFSENKHLSDGDAIPHVKRYDYDEDAEDNVGTYKNDNKVCSFSNGVYTSSTVEFTSLDAKTKYVFRLYITYNANEELIKTWTIETKDSGEISEIKTVSDFESMSNNPEGNYLLANDIDFGGSTIKAIFSSSSTKKFTGTFDGNNYTLSNFKLGNSNTGLFAYTNEAVIKNLKIKPISGNDDYTFNAISGKSTADIGILAGNAIATTFENITIDGATIGIKGNSSAKLNIGIVVGSAERCSFKDVKVTNSSIYFVQLRQVVKAGLFAGIIKGDLPLTDGKETPAVVNCSAEGKISGTMFYSSTSDTDQVIIGGFVGSTGTSSAIKDTYVIVNIDLCNDDSTVSKGSSYRFSCGGFAGANFDGSMKLDGCATIADIKVSSVVANSTNLASETVLTKAFANIGGIVGTVNSSIDSITNTVYVKKTAEMSVEAKTSDLLFVSNTVAKYYNTAKIENVTVETATLSDAVKAVVNQYNV